MYEITLVFLQNEFRRKQKKKRIVCFVLKGNVQRTQKKFKYLYVAFEPINIYNITYTCDVSHAKKTYDLTAFNDSPVITPAPKDETTMFSDITTFRD